MDEQKESTSWFRRIAGILVPNSQAPGDDFDEDEEDASESPNDPEEVRPHTVVTSRTMVVAGETFDVPHAVKATQYGWRARWRRMGYPTRYWRFETADLTRAEKLVQAKAWLAMDHPREFVIQRLVADKASGSNAFVPQFRLIIQEDRGARRLRWMSEKMGSMWFITQERIDEAIEVLNRRLDFYEERRKTMPYAKAMSFHLNEVDPNFVLNRNQRPMRLKVHDLLAWTGEGEGVRYESPETVSKGRLKLYWPELEGFITPRCPTIRAAL